MLGEIPWAVEERFGGDGEELSDVGRCVAAQHRLTGLDALERRLADRCPTLRRGVAPEWGRPVGDTVEHVESVCELVVHDVLAVSGSSGTTRDSGPGEYDRALRGGLS